MEREIGSFMIEGAKWGTVVGLVYPGYALVRDIYNREPLHINVVETMATVVPYTFSGAVAGAMVWLFKH